MSNLQERHYKDITPMETVEKLKSILSRANVEVEEQWSKKSSIDTYSLRVNFKGTNEGANGKGVSETYALASAYAEFFERFQNGLIGTKYMRKSTLPFSKASDEKYQTSAELIEENSTFMEYYFSERNMVDATLGDKINAFKSLHTFDYLLSGKEDSFLSLPFYSLSKKKREYLPFYIYNGLYTSNGMCAGNTKYEALVQGMAEIVERLVQKKLFLEKPVLPDIPDEYIAKFPYIHDMFKKIKKIEGFTFYLKDCSFGGKYPVAALVLIEKNTGRYGIKLGCHPDYGVAMERTFTELTQGQDVEKYANRSTIDFENKLVEDDHNIFNSFKIGLAQYPYQLFGSKPKFPFVPVEDVSSKSNKEIFLKWSQDFIVDGYDVLIRDVSFLGFPSFHIIIPGVSEISKFDEMSYRVLNTRGVVRALLAKPKKITRENSKYIIGVMNFYRDSVLENTLEAMYHCPSLNIKDIPCEDMHCGQLYLIAMSQVLNRNYSEAAKNVKTIISYLNEYSKDKSGINFFYAMYHYFILMSQLNDHSEAIRYISVFFDKDICTRIEQLFKNPDEVIVKQYPEVDYYSYMNKHEPDIEKVDFNFVAKLHSLSTNSKIEQKDIESLFA